MTSTYKENERDRIFELNNSLNVNYYGDVSALLVRFAKDTLFGFYLFYKDMINAIRSQKECYKTLIKIISRLYQNQEDIDEIIENRIKEVEEFGTQIVPLL